MAFKFVWLNMRFENEYLIGKIVDLTTKENKHIIGKLVIIFNSINGAEYVIRTSKGDINVYEKDMLGIYGL